MAGMEPLNSYTWPTDRFLIASMSMRLEVLAARHHLAIRRWLEDGLGPAAGVGVRLESGRVFLLEEFELAVRHHGVLGPYVWVDATEVATHGVEPLVEEFLDAFELDHSSLAHVDESTPSAREMAVELVARMRDDIEKHIPYRT
jgi:hypothetical protein